MPVTWKVSSGMVRMDSTAVSLRITISMLTDRRQQQGEHLRHDHVADGLRPAEAEGAGGIDLAGRDAGEAGAENLGEIGAAIEPEAADADGESIQGDADMRAASIDQEKLHQQRRAAKKLDIAL